MHTFALWAILCSQLDIRRELLHQLMYNAHLQVVVQRLRGATWVAEILALAVPAHATSCVWLPHYMVCMRCSAMNRLH